MTQQQYLIRRKLSVVELAETLGNVSEACRKLGVSRQHFYDIKTALREDGIEGLLEKSRKKPRVDNRIPPEFEQAVLDHALHFPTHGQVSRPTSSGRRGSRFRRRRSIPFGSGTI